ncbi:hypothetical protein [Lacrimispora sp.]|uniref:hypothetical protein n=1 Tax=Lacrimispora sp. TaxID=2719234 RepID=UPI0028623462|nr:hypothetical protein [Lacrimispora sp.]MDR7813904.1 hypothetical protein [Lacrimispora sp.]
MLAGKDLCWLISKTVLLKEIEDNYDCDYGETLIDPRHFYDLVDEQQIIGIKNDWITTKDKLPEDDVRYTGKHIINVIVETNKGLITNVQRIRHKNYDGIYDEWYWGRIFGEVKAWRHLPEPYKERS